MKVQQFVLTKFNLRIAERTPSWAFDKNGKQIDRDEWLQHRFELFEQYCLPSMAAQTNKDFTWLLYFDSETDQQYIDRIERAKQICPQINVVFLDGPHGVQDTVLGMVDEDTDVLITTRFDNDDAFHEEALEIIRAQLDPEVGPLCVNLRYGILLSNGEAQVEARKYNSFASLIEFRKSGPFRAIRGRHGKIYKLAKVKQVGGKPLWLRVIHDRNLVNKGQEDWNKIRVSGLSGFFRYWQNTLNRMMKRLFWPAEVSRDYTLAEVKASFNLKI